MKQVLIIILLSAMEISAGSLYLKTIVMVPAGEVKLGDIGTRDNHVPDALLFPSVNRPFTVSAAEINKKFPELTVYGKEVLILPVTKLITGDVLQEMLAKKIAEKESASPFRISYSGESVMVPEGDDFELSWENLPDNLKPGQRIFILSYFYKGKKVNAQRLKFLIEKKYRAVFSKRYINRGKKLDSDDFELREFYSDTDVRDAFFEDVRLMTSLTNIAPDELLRKKQLKKIMDVEKGSRIKIVYTSGGLMVSNSGFALQSGMIGDDIRVRAGAKTMKTEISALGTVSIK